jgi:hypothetical protein
MPPRPRPSRHPHPGARIAKLGFLDRDAIAALLAPFVADAREREFVLRCLIDEGPAHHRGANYVLLRLLGKLLEGPVTKSEDTCSVPMQLPPHLADEVEDGADQSYPLDLPLAPLDLLAPRGSREQDAMVAALIDGPPQHALANVAMVALIDALLRRRQAAP